MKIAIATMGNKGLEDIVSGEFGHAKTFTIIEIEEGRIKNVEIIDNPAGSISHGRGPIVAKKLKDKGVDMIISGEIGPGALAILDQLKVNKLIVKPGSKVLEVLEKLIIK